MWYNLPMRHALIFLLFLSFPSLACAGPSINFHTESHDFGTVQQGDLLEFTFKFSNIGTDPLIILKLNTS